jgi:folate-dependent phosphoribosylglycinamide formyltransferase PurN
VAKKEFVFKMNGLAILLPAPAGHRPNVAVFLSGYGSNAEQILRQCRDMQAQGLEAPIAPCVLVTDAPKSSRARELASLYGLPVVEDDIRAFYLANGEERVSILTTRGRELRDQWSDRLRSKLVSYKIDFAVFAGFVPLTNLTADFPCLNVHPGDLTYLKDGRRHLVGLHQAPVELAILEGLDYLRSSVILARPYTGKGEDMDNGQILGISPEVPIDMQGEKLEDLRAIAANRPPKRPVGGHQDRLAELASLHLEQLKRGGDWQVLPGVVRDFAKGLYALGGNQLYYRVAGKFHPVETVIVDGDQREPIFAGGQA